MYVRVALLGIVLSILVIAMAAPIWSASATIGTGIGQPALRAAQMNH